MKGSDFVFNYVRLLQFKCHTINPNQGGSYIDSPDWIKNKKATINSINKKDDACFQYAVTATLNHEKIGNYSERKRQTKPFINKHNWERINFPSEKMIGKNLRKITQQLLLMFVC